MLGVNRLHIAIISSVFLVACGGGGTSQTGSGGSTGETSFPSFSPGGNSSGAGFASEIECAAILETEVFLGRSATVVVNLEISATNALSTPVDGITWVMKDAKNEILFTDTWVGTNQKKDFFVYPSEIDVVPIQPGDTTKLRGPTGWLVGHIEFEVYGGPGLDEVMLKTFDAQHERAKKKYQSVTCEVLGYVNDLN